MIAKFRKAFPSEIQERLSCIPPLAQTTRVLKFGMGMQIQSLICTSHALAEPNMQAASDEITAEVEGAVGDPGMPLRRVLCLQRIGRN